MTATADYYYYYSRIRDYSDTITQNRCRGTLQSVSKFDADVPSMAPV